MNSRERVLRAIRHQPADRVPIDFGGTRQSGIAAATHHRLKEYLGIDRPTRVYDLYQMLAEVERPAMERFGADVIGLQRPEVAFGIRNDAWKPWKLFDGTPVEVPVGFNPELDENGDWILVQNGEIVARMPINGYYFDRLKKYPGAAKVPLENFKPPLLNGDQLNHYREGSKSLYHNTDYAIAAAMGPPYELFFGLGTGDFESWMITFATDKAYVHALYEKLVDAWIENLKRFADAVEDRVQIIQICDDFGTQESPFLSVNMFREMLLPHYKRGLDWIHKHTSMKVMLHSDGAIVPLLPSIVEMGVDILNPVQTTAKGMDPAFLKETFGDRLTFWGGSCDCQNTLPFGTADEVRRDAERHLGALAPGGGYVFAPVHNIQAGVPPENIAALFDAALAYRVESE